MHLYFFCAIKLIVEFNFPLGKPVMSLKSMSWGKGQARWVQWVVNVHTNVKGLWISMNKKMTL